MALVLTLEIFLLFYLNVLSLGVFRVELIVLFVLGELIIHVVLVPVALFFLQNGLDVFLPLVLNDAVREDLLQNPDDSVVEGEVQTVILLGEIQPNEGVVDVIGVINHLPIEQSGDGDVSLRVKDLEKGLVVFLLLESKEPSFQQELWVLLVILLNRVQSSTLNKFEPVLLLQLALEIGFFLRHFALVDFLDDLVEDGFIFDRDGLPLPLRLVDQSREDFLEELRVTEVVVEDPELHHQLQVVVNG